MQELIRTIVKELVDYPENIFIEEKTFENKIIYQLSVDKQDLGRVIGKKGRIIGALRTLVKVASAKTNTKKIEIKVLD